MRIGDALHAAVTTATKEWTTVQKKRRRDAARGQRAEVQFWRGVNSEISIRDAAFQVMPAAYASAAGTLNVANARQIMYAARNRIQTLTDKPLDDVYFTQQLLPQYQEEHPRETAAWDVIYDARGDLWEPHTGASCALGTLGVRRYLADAHEAADTGPALEAPVVKLAYPTAGPDYRYTTVLFIEKEGFLEHLRAAKIAARYDLAIMSTKGMASTAARTLLEGLTGVRFLVLHDFDKAGFSIVGTLTRDTARYQFVVPPDVEDLGLRLEDVQAEGLTPEGCVIREQSPEYNLRRNGATQEEIAFLLAKGGQRVELNAFGTDAFLVWLERKLQAAGVEKVVPEAATLEPSYRRAIYIHAINTAIARADTSARQAAATVVVPARLSRQVRRLLRDEPAVSWDAAVARLAAKPGRGRSGHGDTGPAVSGADPLGAKRAKRGTA
jgi:hypothetical protein